MIESNTKSENNLRYFLMLVASVLNETEPPLPDENINWQEVFELASSQSMAAVVFYGADKLPDSLKPDGNVYAYLKQMYAEQLVVDMNLSVETQRMLNLLSDNGISCMPLKGIVTKNDYPLVNLRSMTDVDILCDDRKKAESVFLSEGYVRESVGEKDSSFRKNEILHFEVHSYLVNNTSPAYRYFNNVWKRAITDEKTNIVKMNLDDTYIYMLEHLAGHLEYGGAGVRMFADVYMFLKKHSDKLNQTEISEVLSSIGLDEFERFILKLVNNWFSGDTIPDVSSDYSRFILLSSTFGLSRYTFLSDSIRNSGENSTPKSNGLRRILRKLFPSLKWMKLRFKAVDKISVLYPVFVVVHWFDRLFIRRDVKTYNLKNNYFVSADSDEAKELERIYAEMGLNKRY
ncbi:MAG: hypothetical protein E7532_02355 [Ruminococcaceae bacterium]|nr:hypothetical protein [Oscillospiraceae bacterium]